MKDTGRVTDEILSPADVCKQYQGIFRSPQALADLRWRGNGPDYIKTAEGRAGRVVYRRSAIERWLDERTVSGGAAA
ncbi:DNA-binding protein [Streptomyces sp. NPDC051704]|uniref:DNA-binding protein n=1 Tax=Streptomyces sp. NPDC051704 TaxID=3365671 RepID=UPI0037AC254D